MPSGLTLATKASTLTVDDLGRTGLHGEARLVGVGEAGDIGIAGGVHGDGVALVDSSRRRCSRRRRSAVPSALTLATKASLPPPKIRSGPTVTGNVVWSDSVMPGDIGVAGGVHGDAATRIDLRAADIAEVDERRAVGLDLGHEGVDAADVEVQVGPDLHREARLVGSR